MVAILGSMGMAIIYAMRVNINANIVAMVNKTALAIIDYDDENSIPRLDSGKMKWSEMNYTRCYEKDSFASSQVKFKSHGDQVILVSEMFFFILMQH